MARSRTPDPLQRAVFIAGRQLGVISAVRLALNEFLGSTEDYTLDNLRYSSVPEPGTLALLGLGVAGLAAVRRRKQ